MLPRTENMPTLDILGSNISKLDQVVDFLTCLDTHLKSFRQLDLIDYIRAIAQNFIY